MQYDSLEFFGSRAVAANLMPEVDQVADMDPNVRAVLLQQFAVTYPENEEVSEDYMMLWQRIQPFFTVKLAAEVTASLLHIASTLKAFATDGAAVYTTLTTHPVTEFNTFSDDELLRLILYKAGVKFSAPSDFACSLNDMKAKWCALNTVSSIFIPLAADGAALMARETLIRDSERERLAAEYSERLCLQSLAIMSIPVFCLVNCSPTSSPMSRLFSAHCAMP